MAMKNVVCPHCSFKQTVPATRTYYKCVKCHKKVSMRVREVRQKIQLDEEELDEEYPEYPIDPKSRWGL